MKCRVTIRKTRENYTGRKTKGYSVFKNGHHIQIGMGEPNWFPTKREAMKYKKEVESDCE